MRRQTCGKSAHFVPARTSTDCSGPQEDMANLLSVTTRAYQNYEKERVPFRSLAKIASLTNVSQEWLLRGDVPEAAPSSLLTDVSAGIEQLARSSEDVLRALDEWL